MVQLFQLKHVIKFYPQVIPLFGAVIVPIALVFFFIQSVYVSSSRQLKRLKIVYKLIFINII